jgi:hypothetical protein
VLATFVSPVSPRLRGENLFVSGLPFLSIAGLRQLDVVRLDDCRN